MQSVHLHDGNYVLQNITLLSHINLTKNGHEIRYMYYDTSKYGIPSQIGLGIRCYMSEERRYLLLFCLRFSNCRIYAAFEIKFIFLLN